MRQDSEATAMYDLKLAYRDQPLPENRVPFES